MKKTTKIIALVLVLAVVLCSCGKKEEAKGFSDGLDENGFIAGVKALDYVEIGNVDSIRLKQADIDYEIEYLTSYYFPDEKQITDRSVVRDSDVVNIDYVGKVDGVAFDGGTATAQTVDIANDSYIDGFLESIVGHSVGDTYDAECTFPDEYSSNPDLAGKKAVFTITVNYIAEFVPAEFNDDFVYNNLTYLYYYYYGVNVTTADEFIEFMREIAIENYVYDAVKLKDGAEVPAAVVDYVKNSTMCSLRYQAEKGNGVELITFLKDKYGVETEKEFYEKYADDLQHQAEDVLIMQALAEHFGLSVKEADVKEYFGEATEETLGYDQIVEITGLPYLKQNMIENTVWEHIDTLAVFE